LIAYSRLSREGAKNINKSFYTFLIILGIIGLLSAIGYESVLLIIIGILGLRYKNQEASRARDSRSRQK
jgi:hypothetical protein